MTSDPEYVVLLDADGTPCGTAPKATVHTENTPLHRAFSCYLCRSDGRILLTRRALTKATWPGVWTNSFCGHPGWEESDEDALRRRLADEVGVSAAYLTHIELIDPDFSYRAVDASGIVEWEICPVYVAYVDEYCVDVDALAPCPEEIMEWVWVSPEALVQVAHVLPRVFSPWLVEQLERPVVREGLGVHA